MYEFSQHIHWLFTYALLIHHNLLAYYLLLFVQFLYLLLYWIFHIQSVHIHILLLTQSMYPCNRLFLLIWVPPWITNYNIVSILQIESRSSSYNWNNHNFTILFICEFLYLFFSFILAHRTLQFRISKTHLFHLLLKYANHTYFLCKYYTFLIFWTNFPNYFDNLLHFSAIVVNFAHHLIFLYYFLFFLIYFWYLYQIIIFYCVPADRAFWFIF